MELIIKEGKKHRSFIQRLKLSENMHFDVDVIYKTKTLD